MKRIILLSLILISVLSFQSSAQGNLLITPMRVVFDGSKQNQEFNIVNIGKDSATYIISFLHYNMKEDGSCETIEKPELGKMFADPYLRIYPRRVMLAPGEPQVIMIQYRRKADMLAGEYRSHLYFRAEKNNHPLDSIHSPKDTTQLSIQLTPIYGLSIPVIIRSNAGDVKTTLSDLKLDMKQGSSQDLELTINRTGNISTYGDIIIDYIPAQGKSSQISAIRGVGVYTDINKRNMVIKLNITSGISLKNGKLKVRYISNNDIKKPVVYAVGELDV